MIARVFVVVVLASMALVAQEPSQPPVPSRGNQQSQQNSSTESTIPQPAEGGRGVTITNAPVFQFPTPNPTAEQNRNGSQPAVNGWTKAEVIIMGLLTAALVGIGFYQWRTSSTQGQTLHETLKATKVVERAYVKISHEWPDGATSAIEFVVPDNPANSQRLRCNITVKNEGHTPAHVLGGFHAGRMSGSVQDRPSTPHSGAFSVQPVFLTGGGGDFIRTVVHLPLQRQYGQQGDRLLLIGYVHYQDRFGDCHRTGFCRHLVNGDLVFDQTH